MYIIFENTGEINPTSITTFGVSSKETKNPIGFFGTGLKYAISILLRENQHIQILSGKKSFNFSVSREKIRVDHFDIIKMNGRKLGFTTELGKTWGMDEAFRELYCNTVDEGGRCYTADKEPLGEKGKTYIVIHGKNFYKSYLNKDKIILSSTPIAILPNMEIHPGPSSHIYYRNIKAETLDIPSKYTYNITSPEELTEDRTLKAVYSIFYKIRDDIAEALKDENLLEDIISVKDKYKEKDLCFTYISFPSELFLSKATELLQKPNQTLNESILALLARREPDLSLYEEVQLSELNKQKLERCITFCEKLNYKVRKYPIKTVSNLGRGMLGLAKNNTIYISSELFLLGNNLLAGTLIEEYLHLEENYADLTREFQNYLINKIVSFGEEILKEAL